MSQTGATAKVCVICGQDCSGKPRVKDQQGRYSCKSCQEAALKKAAAAKPAAPRPVAKPAPVPAPEPEPAFDSFDNAAILADLESAPDAVAISSAETCPACGAPAAPGAMVCLNCGFNKASGKAGKVKVSKEGAGAGAVAGAASKILIQANPIAWVVGGVIGGAIGAAIWAFVVYQFNYEISYVAIGVGILTGLGVAAVAQDYASEVTGVVAAVIAIFAVLGGKYAAASLATPEITQKIGEIRATDDDALVLITRDLARDYESKGHQLAWPSGKDLETAEERDDFPRDVRDEAAKKWRAMKPEDREAFKRAMEEHAQTRLKNMSQEDVEEMVFMSSFSAFDLLWFGLAVVAAFGAASGYATGSDD